jgi:DNA-binding transcriptional LysR family regulator
MNTESVQSLQRGRTGYLALLLPRSTADADVPGLLRQLVAEALADSGEQVARVDVVTNQRSDRGPMKRWFVEYVTAPS